MLRIKGLLNALTSVLKSIMSCEVLVWRKTLRGFTLVMFFSKACQHGKTNENVCRNLKYVSIKFAQVDLQKCINWPKKIWETKARLE